MTNTRVPDFQRLMNITWIGEFLRQTDKIVYERFEHTGSSYLKATLSAHYDGGKRLRPIVLACSATLGRDALSRVAHAAAAIELLHMASLFHDDMLDDTRQRRDHPVLGENENVSVAILSGDYLIAEAMSLLAEHTTGDVVKDVVSTMKRMVQSEIETLRRRGRLEGAARDYLRIVSNKTAALFASACGIASRLTEVPPASSDRLIRFGHQLGLAYQLTDDLEDLLGLIPEGDDDIGQGYFSLPLIELWQKATSENRDQIELWLSDLTDSARVNLLAMMNSFATLSSTRALVHRYSTAAILELQGIRAEGMAQSEALEILREIGWSIDQKCGRIMQEYERVLSARREPSSAEPAYF